MASKKPKTKTSHFHKRKFTNASSSKQNEPGSPSSSNTNPAKRLSSTLAASYFTNRIEELEKENRVLKKEMDMAYIQFDEEYESLHRERDGLKAENETLRNDLGDMRHEKEKYRMEVLVLQEKQNILLNERNFYHNQADELTKQAREQKSRLQTLERRQQQANVAASETTGSKKCVFCENAQQKTHAQGLSKENNAARFNPFHQNAAGPMQAKPKKGQDTRKFYLEEFVPSQVHTKHDTSATNTVIPKKAEQNATRSDDVKKLEPAGNKLQARDSKGRNNATKRENQPNLANTNSNPAEPPGLRNTTPLKPSPEPTRKPQTQAPSNDGTSPPSSTKKPEAPPSPKATPIETVSSIPPPGLQTSPKQQPELTEKVVKSTSDALVESQWPSDKPTTSKPKETRIPTRNSATLLKQEEIFKTIDLASYLFPMDNTTSKAKKTKKVSPVFALFQNPQTKADGRQLLQLGSDLRSLSKDLEKAQRELGSFETGLQTETKIIVDTKASIAKNNEKIRGISNWKWTWNKEDEEKQKVEDEADLANLSEEQRAARAQQKAKDFADRKEKRKRNATAQKNAERKRAEDENKLLRKRLEASKQALIDYQKNAENTKPLVFALTSTMEAVQAKMALVIEKLETKTQSVNNQVLESANHLQTLSIELRKSLQELTKRQNEVETCDKDITENNVSLDDARARLKELRTWKYTLSKKQEMAIRNDTELLRLATTDKQKAKIQKRLDERAQPQHEAESKMAARVERTQGEIQQLEKALKSLESKRADQERLLNEITSRVHGEEKRAEQAGAELSKLVDNSSLKEHDTSNFSMDINASENERGLTLLLASVVAGDLETVKMCLDLNADPNQKSENGISPLMAASHFGLGEIAEYLSQNGARADDDAKKDWDSVIEGMQCAPMHLQDWQSTLKIAEQAAVSVEDLFGNAEKLEMSEDTRMMELTPEARNSLPLGFFDESLADATLHQESMKRMVLLETNVLSWLQHPGTDSKEKANFIKMLQGFIPGQETQTFDISRRSIVGIKNSYEVLGVRISRSKMALFSPFCSSEVNGRFTVGVLVWAVVAESRASLYKTLIESTEFLRHKVESDDRFPSFRNAVLPLGMNMHLLDLESTSIYTSRPMDLFTVDVDAELHRLADPEFVPDKRVLDSDRRLADAIFGATNEAETQTNNSLLSESRPDMSTELHGGAGTGKTLLMTKKLISEDADEHLLVLSRLPRLVSAIKARVEEERDVGNITFSTYDDLCSKLAKTIQSEGGHDIHFPPFSKIQYGDTMASTSFQDFVDFLSVREKKQMKQHRIENATLWGAFRTIKGNILCSRNLEHLSRQDYQKLPAVFGFDIAQRNVVYDLFEAYEKWLKKDCRKWDEADRVLFILKYGNVVFSDPNYLSWQDRYWQGRGGGLVDEDGEPKKPFFYHKVYVDEAQDFSELDLALFLRMSGGIRSVFFASDPAQSVEVGLRMRNGTVNDVYHASIEETMGLQVKDTLQTLEMSTNHRTHAQNLALAKAVRKMLTRSFKVPGTNENALINGPMPEVLLTSSLDDLADQKTFRGANVVFLAPDENVDALKEAFGKHGITNDIFGVREAKGLEFDAVALIGFFTYFEHRQSAAQWRNMLLWLFSSKGVTTTESPESIQFGQGRGQKLEACDYLLSHPEVEDEAMLLYTAVTRSRNKLYLIEFENDGVRRRKGEKGLSDFAFRSLKQLDLVKIVSHIDDGSVEMTPQEHKARGVLMITQAIDMARRSSSSNDIRAKFEEARKRFLPSFGNDKDLYDLATKHLDSFLLKITLLRLMQSFFDGVSGSYVLSGKFGEILEFEKVLIRFVALAAWDTFLIDDFHEVINLVEEMLSGTPYIRLGEYCTKLRGAHDKWCRDMREQARKNKA